MPAHKPGFYLNASDNLRPAAIAARRNAELHQILLKIAPQPLAQACCVKQLRAGSLVLLAENAAIAAKLKQLAPRLLSAYQKQRSEVTSIRVEVQVNEAAFKLRPNREPRRLSLETIKNLENLAAGLDESPLKRALTQLAARQRGDGGGG